MILNFKCYSQKNRDFHEVYYGEKRFKGCEIGNPIIVAGYNIRESERNLMVIKEALMQIPNSEVLINKAGSFSIQIYQKIKNKRDASCIENIPREVLEQKYMQLVEDKYNLGMENLNLEWKLKK